MTHDSQFAGPISPIPVLSLNKLCMKSKSDESSRASTKLAFSTSSVIRENNPTLSGCSVVVLGMELACMLRTPAFVDEMGRGEKTFSANQVNAPATLACWFAHYGSSICRASIIQPARIASYQGLSCSVTPQSVLSMYLLAVSHS